MEVAHPNLSVAVPGRIDWAQLSSLSHLGSGNFTIVAPGDSVTYQVNVPSPGVGEIETQSDGVGQSLYALQTGVTTLIDILTRFGAGSGSNAADAFSTLLGITSCADAIGKDLGTIVSGCLSPDDLVKAFGFKALLIAPVMALGGLMALFHSEANAIVDLLDNHDDYKVIISRDAPSVPTTTTTTTTAPTGSLLVGSWSVHDGYLNINANGSGEMYWPDYGGPFTNPDGSPGTGNDEHDDAIRVIASTATSATFVIASIISEDYPGQDPGPPVGSTFTVTVAPPGLTMSGTSVAQLPLAWCDAADAAQDACGA